MTRAVPAAGGIHPLANVLRAHDQAITGLQGNTTGFVIDPTTGHGTKVDGPDMSHVPAFTHTANPIMMATGITGAGMARTKSLITTTISTTNGSVTAHVASATSLANGMQIADANGAIPQMGIGTTFTISGTTLTLSQAATATETGIAIVAAAWAQP